MSNAKRHHYIPASYLAGFTDKRTRHARLVVYDRDKDEFRVQTPDAVAHRRFYYARYDGAGNRDLSIEQFFGKLEGQATAIIATLELGRSITVDEREALSLFVAFLHTRIPKFDRRANEIAGAIRNVAGIDVRMPQSASGGVSITAAERGQTLDMMLRMAAELAGPLSLFNWHFAHAEANSEFITTDAPVVTLPPVDWAGVRGYGFLTPGVSVVVPLTARCALLMEGRGGNLRHAMMGADGVRANNCSIMGHSERFVFSREELYLRGLVLDAHLRQIPLRPSLIVNRAT